MTQDGADDEAGNASAPSGTPDAQAAANPAPEQRQVVGLGDLLGDAPPTPPRPASRPQPKPGKNKKPARPQAAARPNVTPSGDRMVIDLGEHGAQPRPAAAPVRRTPGSFLGFIILAVAGAVVLVMPQTFGVSGLFKFFFAIGMVALYGMLGYIFQWYQPGKGGQRYIDNVYFLGFLYTQVGLVAGFMELWLSSTVDADGIRRITSDELIPIIAAALGASALGLLLKIWLDEVYEIRVVADSGSDEEYWREELGKAAERLATEVNGVVGHFKDLSQTITSATKDMIGAVQTASSTAGGVAQANEGVAQSVRQLAPAFDAFRTTLVTAGNNAAKDVLEVHNDLSSATTSLKEIAEAARGVGAILGKMDTLVGQMDGVLQTTKTASQAAQSASSEFSAEARERIRELAQRLEDLTRIASSDARTGFSTSIDRIDKDLQRTREELGKHVEKFAAAVRQFNGRIDQGS